MFSDKVFVFGWNKFTDVVLNLIDVVFNKLFIYIIYISFQQFKVLLSATFAAGHQPIQVSYIIDEQIQSSLADWLTDVNVVQVGGAGRADVCTKGNFNESVRTHTCETPGCETVAVYDKNGERETKQSRLISTWSSHIHWFCSPFLRKIGHFLPQLCR